MFNSQNSQTLACRIDLRAVKAAKKRQRQKGKRVTLADTECSGLRLVVNAASASWTYAYRKRGLKDGGKRHPQRTLKLGDLATMSAVDARFAAEQVKAAVRSGRDPAAELRADKRVKDTDSDQHLELNAFLKQYIAASLNSGSKHHKNEAANVRKALLELKIGHLEPPAVTVKDLRRLLELHSGRPATARHRFGAISRFFDYLIDEEFLLISPAASISNKRKPSPPTPRQRFYNESELHALWNSASALNSGYCNYLRFLIAVPLRSSETAELTWSNVDFDRMEIKLSGLDTKKRTTFTMPISSLAKAVLKNAADANTVRIFQMSKNVDAPMTAWSHFHDQVRAVSGVSDFSRHDLRRTFSTLIGKNSDFNNDIIDSLLKQKQSPTLSGVEQSYQQAQRLFTRRQVMQKWSDQLSQIINRKQA